MRKQYALETKSAGERSFEFVISTGSLDRNLDRVDAKCIDLSAFEKNLAVLWAHGSSVPPIGRATTTRVRGDALVSTVEFPEPGVYELSDTVRGLIDAGLIKAASIGFRPLESERNEEGGLNFTRVELVEWPVVPVPANADAVVQLAQVDQVVRKSRKALRSIEHMSPKALKFLVRHLVRQEIARTMATEA